ncbi:MAG: hypothetical protein WKF82_08795 [Nocardioidaceae bacterium]
MTSARAKTSAVTHVEVARGVGKHVQQIAALAAAVIESLERVKLLPHLQPLLLRGFDVVCRSWLGGLRAHHRCSPVLALLF